MGQKMHPAADVEATISLSQPIQDPSTAQPYFLACMSFASPKSLRPGFPPSEIHFFSFSVIHSIIPQTLKWSSSVPDTNLGQWGNGCWGALPQNLNHFECGFSTQWQGEAIANQTECLRAPRESHIHVAPSLPSALPWAVRSIKTTLITHWKPISTSN